MLFLLSTPQYNNVQSNTARVKVHLRNGVAEILDKHQDLMGKVENNLIEVETNFENKIEKFVFVVQDGVFVVSNKGLDENIKQDSTGIYVYAKRAYELKNASIEDISKQCEEKQEEINQEVDKLKDKNTNPLDNAINSKILLAQADLAFFQKVLFFLKEGKN